jgi:kynurenine 3-monooxygenase
MKVIIVGAGPSGLLLAHRLLARNQNYSVQIFERLEEPSLAQKSDSREFGFGLGTKAQEFLKSIEGWERIIEEALTLQSRQLMLISRRQLCAGMLQLLKERYENRCQIEFNTPVVEVFLESRQVLIEQGSQKQKIAYDLLVAADGVHSTIRQSIVAFSPQEYTFQQRCRPHVWKVLQLPKQPTLTNQAPRLIRIQKSSSKFGNVFGAYLPCKDGSYTALIFWQPTGNDDQTNPWGITTCEQLQELLYQKSSKDLPVPLLEPESARIFLESRPSHEYWSQCDRYHHTEGRVITIGDAAHNMFSIFGQGCTAALADAILLDRLLEKYSDDLLTVLPEFSKQAVPEGQAVSDLNLMALIVYRPRSRVFYTMATLVWVLLLRKPNIFARINQVNTTYSQVLQENQFWVWLAKQQFIT